MKTKIIFYKGQGIGHGAQTSVKMLVLVTPTTPEQLNLADLTDKHRFNKTPVSETCEICKTHFPRCALTKYPQSCISNIIKTNRYTLFLVQQAI